MIFNLPLCTSVVADGAFQGEQARVPREGFFSSCVIDHVFEDRGLVSLLEQLPYILGVSSERRVCDRVVLEQKA